MLISGYETYHEFGLWFRRKLTRDNDNSKVKRSGVVLEDMIMIGPIIVVQTVRQ